jgi:hypothetical protein
MSTVIEMVTDLKRTRLPPLSGHVGVPRALKSDVNKERPLQIAVSLQITRNEY